jgi:hypothetical protein
MLLRQVTCRLRWRGLFRRDMLSSLFARSLCLLAESTRRRQGQVQYSQCIRLVFTTPRRQIKEKYYHSTCLATTDFSCHPQMQHNHTRFPKRPQGLVPPTELTTSRRWYPLLYRTNPFPSADNYQNMATTLSSMLLRGRWRVAGRVTAIVWVVCFRIGFYTGRRSWASNGLYISAFDVTAGVKCRG